MPATISRSHRRSCGWPARSRCPTWTPSCRRRPWSRTGCWSWPRPTTWPARRSVWSMRSRLAEVQEDVQPFDLPGAAEERRAGGRVEVEAVPGPAGAVRPGHHQPGRPLAVHHDRHLAGGVPERAGGQLDRVWRTGHVQVPERARLGQGLAAPEQVDPGTYPAPLDGKGPLPQPGDDVLLDLSGHARLLGPGEPWRVRVRVGRDRTVYLRRLVYADAVAYRLVVRSDPGQAQHVCAAGPAGPCL